MRCRCVDNAKKAGDKKKKRSTRGSVNHGPLLLLLDKDLPSRILSDIVCHTKNNKNSFYGGIVAEAVSDLLPIEMESENEKKKINFQLLTFNCKNCSASSIVSEL
jgi:hypothetical protein